MEDFNDGEGQSEWRRIWKLQKSLVELDERITTAGKENGK